MKKYSSHIDLKMGYSPRGYQGQQWCSKIITTPIIKRPDIPSLLISKQSFVVPNTAKYSAGYLQNRKIFSSKKQNKDILNINNNTQNNFIINRKCSFIGRTGSNQQEGMSKIKKIVEDNEKILKKQKIIKLDKPQQLQHKQNLIYLKPSRFSVQSPKGNLIAKIKQQKSKSKSKIKDKQKDKQKDKEKDKQKDKDKGQKKGFFLTKKKTQEKKQKQQNVLNQYITKYQPQPKNILLHCTSQSHLLKLSNLQQKKEIKGYYKSTIYNAFFSNKPSTFNQICKNHLITSMQFLTYAKKNQSFIPSTFDKIILPITTKKTLIFDLDQTLIHCNQSLDSPYDVALEICFPSSTKIKAGINIRPYAVECLKELSKYYQIIVFTASHQCYANVIIDYLDPNKKFVSHRFFRETCYKTQEGFYTKDLRVFGRDLSNVLLVDNAAYSYCFQPQNGVPIVPFYNNKADMQLKEVTTYLKELVEGNSLRKMNENHMKLSQYHRFSCPKQLINQLYF